MESNVENKHFMDTEAAGGNHDLTSYKSGQKEGTSDCEPDISPPESTSMVVDEPSASGVDSSVDSSQKIRMLARVAVSDAHFKHQQRGEPELTLEDKIEIAQSIFDKSKANFLSRFWNYLELEDIEVFKNSMDGYEVDFYVKQIMKSKNKVFQQNRVKNRRYEAMKELISEGEYFSEEEMKYREPYLYEQFVGQYLTQEEIQAKVDKSDLTFSNILLKHIDQLDENVRFSHAQDVEVSIKNHIQHLQLPVQYLSFTPHSVCTSHVLGCVNLLAQ